MSLFQSARCRDVSQPLIQEARRKQRKHASWQFWHPVPTFLASVILTLASLPAAGQTVGGHSLVDMVSHSAVLPEPLLWTGDVPPSTQENQALLAAFQLVTAVPWPNGLPVLEDFITSRTGFGTRLWTRLPVVRAS